MLKQHQHQYNQGLFFLSRLVQAPLSLKIENINEVFVDTYVFFGYEVNKLKICNMPVDFA